MSVWVAMRCQAVIIPRTTCGGAIAGPPTNTAILCAAQSLRFRKIPENEIHIHSYTAAIRCTLLDSDKRYCHRSVRSPSSSLQYFRKDPSPLSQVWYISSTRVHCARLSVARGPASGCVHAMSCSSPTIRGPLAFQSSLTFWTRCDCITTHTHVPFDIKVIILVLF